MVKFGAKTKEDVKAIDAIVTRALGLGVREFRLNLYMDIDAAHGSCPLKLDELLKADDYNFLHDVCGINRHINRRTGELENCFLPRFAQ